MGLTSPFSPHWEEKREHAAELPPTPNLGDYAAWSLLHA